MHFRVTYKIILLLSMFLYTGQLMAVSVSGVVVNAQTRDPLPNVTVIDLRTNMGTTTNSKGWFRIDVEMNDNLKFSSVGYKNAFKTIENTDSLFVGLTSALYTLESVDIVAKEKFPPSYKSTVYPGGEPNVLEAFASPISFLYYTFNKREKLKRKMRKRFDYDRRMERVRAILNRDLFIAFTGFSGSELDACIVYCNAHINLEETDTEFIIKHKLLEVLSAYKNKK